MDMNQNRLFVQFVINRTRCVLLIMGYFMIIFLFILSNKTITPTSKYMYVYAACVIVSGLDSSKLLKNSVSSNKRSPSNSLNLIPRPHHFKIINHNSCFSFFSSWVMRIL